MMEKWLYRLEELRREQSGLVVKKSAHPGGMAKIGLSVPHGFALTVNAYTHFMKEAAATPEIAEMIKASGITAEDIAGIGRPSLAIRGAVSKTIPAEMESITVIATNLCIESTARDGFNPDYHIVMMPSGVTGGTSAEARKLALANIDTFFGEVVNSKSLLGCWNLAEWGSHGRHHSDHRAAKEGNNV